MTNSIHNITSVASIQNRTIYMTVVTICTMYKLSVLMHRSRW